MNQPGAGSLRDVMPETADWIDKHRAQWGRAHVDMCLRKGLAGVPGYFYAMERGRTVGTPWPMGEALALLGPGASPQVAALQQAAVMCGCAFAAFMREPAQGGVHGAY